MPRTHRPYPPSSLAPPPVPVTPCPPPYQPPRAGKRLIIGRIREDPALTYPQAAICWTEVPFNVPFDVVVFDCMDNPPQIHGPEQLLAALEERRARLRMPKTALSQLSGVPIATVRRALRRGRHPISVSLDTVMRISEAMGARVGMIGYSPRRTRYISRGAGLRTTEPRPGWCPTLRQARMQLSSGVLPIPMPSLQAYHSSARRSLFATETSRWKAVGKVYADQHAPAPNAQAPQTNHA